MRRLALLIPLVILLVGCGGKSATSGATKTKGSTMNCEIGGDKSKAELANLDEGKTHEIVVNTNKGSFTFELATKISPCATASIAGLVQKGFFDGLTFHRIVPGFVIQGGDPTGTGRGGPGYQFEDEVKNNQRKHQMGSLSMANAGPNTNGSQFFITHVATDWLNGKHTVFGQVRQGQETVDAIREGDELIAVIISEQ